MRKLLLLVVIVACDSGKPAPPAPSTPADPFASLDLPAVPTKIADVLGSAQVVVTKSVIAVDGRSIVTLANGKIAGADKEGGELGVKVPKLITALTKQEPLVLALDSTALYGTLLSVMFTAKQQPVAIRQFAIVARAVDTKLPTMLRLALPDKSPSAGGVVALPGGSSPRGRVTVTEQTGTPSSLTPEIVAAKVKVTYLAGIRRCYTTLLARDPTAKGSIKLAFSVDAAGNATAAHADGVAADCVTPQMQSWRFALPEAAPASFKLTLTAEPDDRPSPHVASTGGVGVDPDEPKEQIIQHMPLKLIVTVTKTEMSLWSIGGEEGTLQAPKLRVGLDDAALIHSALVDISQRRFNGTIPDGERTIIFQAMSDTTAATFVPVMAAMQSVFPDLLLSSGFE